jgi:hypothetical protein
MVEKLTRDRAGMRQTVALFTTMRAPVPDSVRPGCRPATRPDVATPRASGPQPAAAIGRAGSNSRKCGSPPFAHACHGSVSYGWQATRRVSTIAAQRQLRPRRWTVLNPTTPSLAWIMSELRLASHPSHWIAREGPRPRELVRQTGGGCRIRTPARPAAVQNLRHISVRRSEMNCCERRPTAGTKRRPP